MREEAEQQWQLALEAREEAEMTSAEFESYRKLIRATRGERLSLKRVLARFIRRN
jgi:hypothetical protein